MKEENKEEGKEGKRLSPRKMRAGEGERNKKVRNEKGGLMKVGIKEQTEKGKKDKGLRQL